MATSSKSNLSQNSLSDLAKLDPSHDNYAAQVLDALLNLALRSQATDIHLGQDHSTLTIQLRQFGNLVPLGQIEDGVQARVMGRLKALAQMVTYRSDIPQEGRLWLTANSGERIEARVGTLPTLNGERAVIRLSRPSNNNWKIDDLGLPDSAATALRAKLHQPSGVILITGPAASGKTSTAYACLREIIAAGTQRSVVSLEDPIEQEIASVAQSQIQPSVEYTWSAGLKALLRQDPDVLLIGEIRDAETARVVFQAAMTGQLVIATMHARSVVDAIQRLIEMEIQTHHLRSCLDFLSCQRLLPQRCVCQRSGAENKEEKSAVCANCQGLGFDGYVLLSELLPNLTGNRTRCMDGSVESLVSLTTGMETLAQQAQTATIAERVLPQDVRRHIEAEGDST